MSTLTASSIFLKALSDAGITHAFVNWGSDHPALLEDLERQRIENDDGSTSPKIVTCPNEMVALSAAHGYAQVTGKPAAVFIHVDVGTQALAGAIHNADRGRVPVFIYAGASAHSHNQGIRGQRNEWIMWAQDIPDQSAIVRQYMRHTVQLNSYMTIPQAVNRSLQLAMSEPKGPVYLWARREVMEEQIPESQIPGNISPVQRSLSGYPVLQSCALSPTVASTIATALLTAVKPLIITSYLGRNAQAVAPLVALSTLLAIPVFSTCPSAINIPFSHPNFAGLSYLQPGTHTHLPTADVIIIIDCEIPWIEANGDAPHADARIFILDSGDPLKRSTGSWDFPAEMICHADAETALGQITDAIRHVDGAGLRMKVLEGLDPLIQKRSQQLLKGHSERMYTLELAEVSFAATNVLTTPNVIGALRRAIERNTPFNGAETLVLNEAISNYGAVWNHMRPEVPGSMMTSGGSSLGWALGAAVGAFIGGEVAGSEPVLQVELPTSGCVTPQTLGSIMGKGGGYELVVAIVGDGSFMFGVPSSAYWMARRYNTPFLTIVLNNGGWKSPKLSMLGVHPAGHGSQCTDADRLSVGFGPHSPDYGGIAAAASDGWAWTAKVGVGLDVGKAAVDKVMNKAVRVVVQEKRCAVVECMIESI